MMLLEDAHNLIRKTIRKSQGSYVSPEDIDLNLNRSLNDYVNFLLRPNGNTNNQPLTRYISEQPYTSSSTNRFPLPDNFLKEINIYSSADGTTYEGDILKEQEFTDRKNSYITSADTVHPIARLLGTTETALNGVIEILPSQGNFVLSYYRTIINCVYAYDSPDNRSIVFNEDDSVDIDCNSGVLSEIVSRALTYFGISLEAQNLLSEEVVKNGNS